MVRKCELCEGVARMYCESDQANLCWDCDEKVHRANFLVAKHSRSLLCHVCQSLTPWKASGQKLAPTVSVCDTCVASTHCKVHDERSVERDDQSEGGDDADEENDRVDDVDQPEDEDDYEDDDVDDDEDDENQVVPWSGDLQSTPPPPVASSSCSSSVDEISLKRMRDFADFCSDDEIGCSSSQLCSRMTGNEEAYSSLSSFRPLKQARTMTTTTTTTVKQQDNHGEADSRSAAIVRSLQNLQKKVITNGGDASATILGVCQLSRDQSR